MKYVGIALINHVDEGLNHVYICSGGLSKSWSYISTFHGHIEFCCWLPLTSGVLLLKPFSSAGEIFKSWYWDLGFWCRDRSGFRVLRSGVLMPRSWLPLLSHVLTCGTGILRSVARIPGYRCLDLELCCCDLDFRCWDFELRCCTLEFRCWHVEFRRWDLES